MIRGSLSAPKQPAGLFDVLVRTLPEATAQLGEVLRFAEPWEREASIALRDALSPEDADQAISAYEEHGRIHYADKPERAAEAAFAAWHADILAGRDSILLAPSWATVRDLNARARLVARAERRLTSPDVTIGDNPWAVGDLLVTRLNDYTLRDSNGAPVLNGDRWTVTAATWSGLRLRRAGGTATVGLPTAYVAQHAVHGYAATVHSTQGMTCDTAHVVATAAVPRDALYVALTRGRASNRLYVGNPPADCDRPEASIIDDLSGHLRASAGRDDRPDAAPAIGHTF